MIRRHRGNESRRSHMARRRGFGAAAAAVVAAALLSTSVAFADDYTDTPDPSPAEFLGLTGMPPLDEDVLSRNLFDVIDQTDSTPSAPHVVGEFFGNVSTFTTPFSFSNEAVLVTQDEHVPVLFSGPPGADFAGFGMTHDPAAGSVFDTMSFGSGFENVYSDLVGAASNGTNLITDTWETPFGDVDLSPFVTFDAALNPSLYFNF